MSEDGFDVLITGAGVVGGQAGEFLARRPEIRSLAIVDRDLRRAEGAAWRIRLGSVQEGRDIRIRGISVDLADVDATRAVIETLKPKVIFHAATILTVPEMAQRLRPETFARVRESGMAGFVPAHAYLGICLQKALAGMADRPPVIMAPFPDFTIPILARLGVAPIAGIGNVDNMAGELKSIVAEKLGISALDVVPMIIAHHAVNEWFLRSGNADKAPWFAKVFASGVDVTDQFDLNALLAESAARLRGLSIDSRVSSSAVKAILAVLQNRGTYMHTPGAAGLPGGWPARLYRNRAEIVPIPGLPHEKALAINLAGQHASGLEALLDDGTMVLTAECAKMLSDLFGLQVARIAPADIAAVALALRAALDRRAAAGG